MFVQTFYSAHYNTFTISPTSTYWAPLLRDCEIILCRVGLFLLMDMSSDSWQEIRVFIHARPTTSFPPPFPFRSVSYFPQLTGQLGPSSGLAKIEWSLDAGTGAQRGEISLSRCESCVTLHIIVNISHHSGQTGIWKYILSGTLCIDYTVC